MQTIDSKINNITVVAFNPALKLSREKQALQLIKEYKEIFEMEKTWEQMEKLDMWREAAFTLASESKTN